jgi:hypothetical protein
MKTQEFHKPFINALVLVALVTVFTMISSRYIVRYYVQPYENTHLFTSEQSQFSSKSPE